MFFSHFLFFYLTGILYICTIMIDQPHTTTQETDMTYHELIVAAAFAEVEDVKAALEKGADQATLNEALILANDHLIPLQRRNRHKITKMLLAAGADPNTTIPDTGWTVLHFVARKGTGPTAKTLLAAGADPSIANKAGHLPLEYALEGAEHGFAARAAHWRHGCQSVADAIIEATK
jgi:ankyrin repeat protein